MTFLYILLAIFIFGVLIGIHEFGHFITAKAFDIKVEEFSIGMGPALWKKQKGETLYALRAIPIGGFCAMTGEDGESDDPRAFVNRKWWQRLVVLFAGAFMNFLLGFLIVVILYANAGAFRTTIIDSFAPDSPYNTVDGLHAGDRIIKLDGCRVYDTDELAAALAEGDGCYDMVVVRDGKRVKLKNYTFVPVDIEGYDRKMYGINFGYEEATLGVKLRCSWESTMQFVRWVWQGLEMLFGGQVTLNDMSGPVGIVDLMAETATQAETTADGLYNVFYLSAFIAVNLAVMNLLPIPALDGGRIFLLLVATPIEHFTKKRIDPKIEGYIHAAGMVLLLAFMAVIMFNDILRIIRQ